MPTVRNQRRLNLNVWLLESRINPAFLISNTLDYDPTQYDQNLPSTYIVGSARWAIQKAAEAGGGEVRFNDTIDLDPGAPVVRFGDPIVPANTIELEYGEIRVSDDNLADDHWENISIHGPKFYAPTKHHVKIIRTGFVSPFGDDLSVFHISNQRNPEVPAASPPWNPYAPHYTSASLGGLLITGGSASVGAGVLVEGFVNLEINDCQIISNTASPASPFDPTAGGGIAAVSMEVPISEIAGSSIAWGPNVVVAHTLSDSNIVEVNDGGAPPFTIDICGGID